MPNKSRASRQS